MSSPLSPDDRATLQRSIKAAYALARKDSSESAWKYLHHVLIDRPPEPCLYADVAESWQWGLAARLVPALEAAAGVRHNYTGPRNFWLTLPRGHDKTGLIGRLSSWALAFSRRPIRAVAAAADKDQAGLLAEFMQAEVKLNPWLAEMLSFGNWKVEGPQGSRMKILSADAASSFGLKEDLHVLDELTHWPKRGLFDTIFTGLEKRAGLGVMFIITNAGTFNTWQRDVFEAACKSPDWYVYEAPGKLAGWMSDARLLEQRRIVPAGLAKRLYDNKWVDPSEESGFVTRDEARLCVDTSLSRREQGIKEHRPYYAAIDYGPVKDRTVLCVLHTHDGRVVLDRMDVWQGSPQNRVKIDLVERWIEDVARDYYRPTFVIDPYNMEGTLQRFEGSLDVVRFEARGGKANYQLAANLRALIVNKKIAWYPGAGELLHHGKHHDLVDEFADVTLKPMSYGFRIQNEGNTHDDRVVALGMAALHAVQGQGRVTLPPMGEKSRWF